MHDDDAPDDILTPDPEVDLHHALGALNAIERRKRTDPDFYEMAVGVIRGWAAARAMDRLRGPDLF